MHEKVTCGETEEKMIDILWMRGPVIKFYISCGGCPRKCTQCKPGLRIQNLYFEFSAHTGVYIEAYISKPNILGMNSK